MGKTKRNNMVKKPEVKKSLMEDETPEIKLAKAKNKFRLRSEESEFIDSKSSGRILSAARRQQIEIYNEDNVTITKSFRPNFPSLGGGDASENQHVSDRDFYDDLQINEEDEKALDAFKNVHGKKSQKLSDVIMERIAEKQADINTKLSDDGTLRLEELPPKVREMYEGVRDVMKRYRSGKVPKAFKIIPKLKNWEQILLLTEPYNWSAAAMFQGTRIFSSILSEKMAQRFYHLVLLPRIRDDLCEYKRLNMHLYNSLKKSLFKPGAFMKGIILPLLESGDCTLREAIIFGSVVARNTIPVLHSSAALLKICEMEYTGANSILIRILLDKRYALPYRVVDAAVFHFLRFEHDKREMPILWHQSLLTFVQRYKNDITEEQKESIFALLRKQQHPKITPEIRRELQAAKCRDDYKMEEQPQQSPGFSGNFEMEKELYDNPDGMDDE